MAICPELACAPDAVATAPPAPPYLVLLAIAITMSASGAEAAACRALVVLTHSRRSVPPHQKYMSSAVARDIQQAMKKAGLNATAYWLRHTYAQHLLTAGASIYEIKEMLGHRHIESSRKYLYIHTELMREVILDEPL